LVDNQIEGIHITCILSDCLQCELTEFIIVFFSDKWVALTRAVWCVVCVWSTIRQSALVEVLL